MKPIFLATHPRAISSAFERVGVLFELLIKIFISSPNYECFHEPLSDAYYYGPERISKRFDEKACLESGRSEARFEEIMKQFTSGKRVFIKEMAQCLYKPGESKPFLPIDSFQFTFLIRSPKLSIPSYYRCCVPPNCEKTGWFGFDAEEAGYKELRQLYDEVGGLVIDADDLLRDPEATLRKYCEAVDAPFSPEMLVWNKPGDESRAEEAFRKFSSWHLDVMKSNGLQQKEPKALSDEEYKAEWVSKFGEDGAKIIEDCVQQNMADYNYLRQLAAKI